jgi:predicted amidophosphoribosyltransferase
MNLIETFGPVPRIGVVRPPLHGPGVCGICRGPARARSDFCWCCRKVCSVLGESPGSMPRVVPMVVFRPGDSWNLVLRRYKDAPVVAARRYFANLLAAEIQCFFDVHGDCIRRQTAGFGAYCVVPTSRPQPRATSPHPLEVVLAGVSAFTRLDTVRLSPSKPAHHLQPDAEAFVPADAADVAGRRVLVVDDSWVTGARALSAVAALRSAGALVAGVVVVGRSVDPSASLRSMSWWTNLVHDSVVPGDSDDAAQCSDACYSGRFLS